MIQGCSRTSANVSLWLEFCFLTVLKMRFLVPSATKLRNANSTHDILQYVFWCLCALKRGILTRNTPEVHLIVHWVLSHHRAACSSGCHEAQFPWEMECAQSIQHLLSSALCVAREAALQLIVCGCRRERLPARCCRRLLSAPLCSLFRARILELDKLWRPCGSIHTPEDVRVLQVGLDLHFSSQLMFHPWLLQPCFK